MVLLASDDLVFFDQRVMIWLNTDFSSHPRDQSHHTVISEVRVDVKAFSLSVECEIYMPALKVYTVKPLFAAKI